MTVPPFEWDGRPPALAQLEFFHSRPIAPTRRVALGESMLPCDPAPGLGGVLLGAVVADGIQRTPDDFDDAEELVHHLEHGLRVSQPRLRHRFQTDQVGLLRHRSRLVRGEHGFELDVEDAGSSATQRMLAALYAAGEVALPARKGVFKTIRRALHWKGPIGPALFVSLSGAGGQSLLAFSLDDPVAWALDRLGCEGPELPDKAEIQKRFRARLREAHPDHGGQEGDAAEAIAELREARRILLA